MLKTASRPLSRWFYLEVVLGLVGISLFALTLIWNEWIEIVFRIDPDAGNGSAEFLACAVLLAVAAISWWMARTEWRTVGRTRPAPER